MSDLRPPIAAALDAFGVAATVTPPGAAAVSTRVIWHASQATPVGEEQQRVEQRRVITVPVDDVPQLPRLTKIQCPEYLGGPSRTWTVDSSERPDYDHHRAYIIES